MRPVAFAAAPAAAAPRDHGLEGRQKPQGGVLPSNLTYTISDSSVSNSYNAIQLLNTSATG